MKLFKLVFFYLGISLVCLNITGSFLSLRNKNYIETLGIKKPLYSSSQAIEQINRKDLKGNEYLYHLNNVINRSMIHSWSQENNLESRLWIPAWENYILYFSGFLHPRLRSFEIPNYKKALDRGLGLCSQYAIIVDQVLKSKKIPSKLLGLGGHVVTTVESEDKTWWILDADYGVVIPHSIQDIYEDPSIITNYYIQKVYSEKEAIEIRDIYQKEENFLGEDWYSINYKYIFILYNASTFLKWFLPLILIYPYISSKVIFNNINTKNKS
tara:strand:+ start:297 stop:1103 length:807 start_codon:yes stop_codon:yes gene_type:complete